MRLAVVGGGWAGLAAAVRLRRAGHGVVVYESSATPGGRARRVPWRPGVDIDNGQHILLGAYAATLGLMRDLGLDAGAAFHRMPLAIESADGGFRLKTPGIAAPFHLLAGILSGRGMRATERLSLMRAVAALRLRGWRMPPGATVGDWLLATRQSPHMVERLWRPLCVAALNTPPDQACAGLFARVLRDSLGGRREATDMLLPRVDLSALWPDQAVRRLAAGPDGASAWRPSHTVRQLAAGAGHVEVDGESYDAVVLAGNAASVRTLLAQLPRRPGGEDYLGMLSAFAYLPIATLTLQLKAAWPDSSPMLLLREDPARLHFGQWLFNRRAYAAPGTPAAAALLHVVVSDARALMEHDRPTVIARIIDQVREQTRARARLPEVLGHHLIVEKRATFAALPGLRRPPNTTPWPRVWAAGDWTDTSYPAVLEGAVISGNRAAEELMASRDLGG
ncbi:hydroxysqualene dehydroxylase HpnE [Parapusillimonas granuli]|uniref:FAD-dependent oxidoreductase n=1 Tax=Parapusillimonas granuli TaxID=380911 RepID=A0A853G460_9BURK|nr:squalene-associated FAD-dependent desaturase [Parapusillimonas granuli]MEB2401519.1 hydroxysqualene dehydroxylase HpnE [Alcaligenaceae bacterium]NYT51673.1 FAD-dependent oxidoreductase [Parapusillimonas granuli]